MPKRATRRASERDAEPKTKLHVVRAPARRPKKDPAVAARTSVILLLVPAALLTTIGVVEVFSASSVYAFTNYDNSFWFLERQAIYAAIGIGALLLTARMRYTAWRRLSGPLLVISVALLLRRAPSHRGLVRLRRVALDRPGTVHAPAVRVREARADRVRGRGPRAEGRQARRLAAPRVAARSRRAARRRDRDAPAGPGHDDRDRRQRPADAVRRRRAPASPDGDGRRRRSAGSRTSSSARRTAAPGSCRSSIPWKDPLSNGYQLIQGLIALGSGGWFGVGLGASRQKWAYLPNAHTDFIFAVLGEELGLIGELVVLVAFGVMIYAGIRIAVRAPDTFGRLLAAGITSWIGSAGDREPRRGDGAAADHRRAAAVRVVRRDVR